MSEIKHLNRFVHLVAKYAVNFALMDIVLLEIKQLNSILMEKLLLQIGLVIMLIPLNVTQMQLNVKLKDIKTTKLRKKKLT